MRSKKRYLQINQPHATTKGATTELSAEIIASDNSCKPFSLWYRFPSYLEPYVHISADSFLAALLPLAMFRGYDLLAVSPVSERLYFQVQQVMEIFSEWFDNMNTIDIRAELAQVNHHNSQAVGSFFTGGVDSFYTVLKNLDLYQNESRISHLIYVQGFDVDINNKELFSRVRKEIEAAGSELNVKSIFIKTNLREITDRHIRWGEHQHGAALASVGLCLSKLFKTILIPSSVPYSELYPWGSHPITDPLWSNELVQFIHDGNEAKRSQKVLWQLSKSEVALKHLRVCWENPDNKYNCGMCGKCIRTKINLKVAGVLNQCQTLDNDLNMEGYKRILLNSFVERRNLKENIDLLREEDGELKKSLEALYISSKKKSLKFSDKLKKVMKKYI